MTQISSGPLARAEERQIDTILSADEAALVEAVRFASSFGADPSLRYIYVHDVPLEVFARDGRIRDTYEVESSDGHFRWRSCSLDVGAHRIVLMSTNWSVDEEASS